MAGKDWDQVVTRAANCCRCEKEFAPEQVYHATIVEGEQGFERRDYCEGCFTDADRDQAFSFWQATKPKPEEKPRLFVDNEVLLQIFRRLLDTDDESRRAFTFVLALVLMRKRLLKYLSTENREGQEYWRISLRGDDKEYRVLNPQLTDDQLNQVRDQLHEILAEN